MKKETKKPQIAIYQTLGDEQKISVRIEDENVWLTQKLMAELFDVDVRTINPSSAVKKLSCSNYSLLCFK